MMIPQLPTHLTGVIAAPPTNTTLATPQGPIQWTRSPDGSLQASGGGQTVTVTGADGSDGSSQNSAKYAKTGNAPYLSIAVVGSEAARNVACTLSAGSSQLTLTIANIDVLVRSGTATLSGTWNGAAVNWTGPVDLTSNPLVGRPITGWPAGAFTTELQQAAFFAPLGESLARTIVPSGRTTGGADHMLTAGGSFSKAVGWCMAGMAGGLLPGAATGGTGFLVLCAGGAGASFVSDFIDWWNAPSTTPPPPVGQGSESQTATDSGDDSQSDGGQGGDQGGGGRTDLGGFQLGGGGGDGGGGLDPSRQDGPSSTYKEN